MGKHPILHYINEIKNKLGFGRTMTADGADVVDAVNKQAGKVGSILISNEYSSILDAVNAYKAVKAFPFTIQKYGNGAFTDLPAEMASNEEWNLLCYGDQMRITLILSRYSNADATYVRTMFNGSYVMSNWLGYANSYQIETLDTAINTKNGLDYIEVNLSSLGVNLTNSDNGIYWGYYDISALLPSGVSGVNIVGVTLGPFREFVWFNVSHQYLLIHSSRAMNYANYPNDRVRIWYRR